MITLLTTAPLSTKIKSSTRSIPAEQHVADSLTQEDKYQDDYVEVHPEEHTASPRSANFGNSWSAKSTDKLTQRKPR